jgi:alanine transaminase
MGPNSYHRQHQVINPSIKAIEYAIRGPRPIRGPLPIRVSEIEKEIEKGVKKPSKNVNKAKIGDPHAMGNPSVTFI